MLREEVVDGDPDCVSSADWVRRSPGRVCVVTIISHCALRPSKIIGLSIINLVFVFVFGPGSTKI